MTKKEGVVVIYIFFTPITPLIYVKACFTEVRKKKTLKSDIVSDFHCWIPRTSTSVVQVQRWCVIMVIGMHFAVRGWVTVL